MAGGADDADSEIVGINVTPLVDVTLVLLIIFMVTARLIAQSGLSMELPKAANGGEVQTVFSVSLAADGRVLVDSTQVANDDAIGPLAKAAHEKNSELRAVIKADASVNHGRVIHVLDVLKTAGIAKIAFGVTPTGPAAPSK